MLNENKNAICLKSNNKKFPPLPAPTKTSINLIAKNMEDISPEEFGFTINPACKICNSVYKPEIDKMLLDEVKTSRIVDFCTVIDPSTGKQRISGTKKAIKRNLLRHKKHIAIDKSKIEEAQKKSMVLYKAKVKEEITLEKAKQIATQRMIDQLSDASKDFSISELAIPISLEQRERSVKVEEDSVKIAFAKFLKQNNDEKEGGVATDKIKSLENTIREAERTLARIEKEIRLIEGAGREKES